MNHLTLKALSLVTLLIPLSVFAQRGPLPVFIQDVKTISIEETIEALGTLKANESTVLSSSVTESITAIHFNDNQRVQAGDVLVEMTSAEEHAQLKQAMATLDEAERQYGRFKALEKDKVATAAQLDQQKVLVDAAEAQLRAVQSRLQDRLLIAPFDGVVGLRNISVGALVRPGDVITTLDDDSVMKLDMTVPSIYLADLRVGMPVVARATALRDQSFNGKLVGIDSRVDPVTRSLVARALIENPEGKLRPGLLMTVLLSQPQREAMMIAEEAIIQVGRQAHVFVIERDGERTLVAKRDVALGVRRPGEVEILSGLNAGDQVVVHGGMKLRPGVEVKISGVSNNGERLPQLLAQ
ncbi:efflux RND transporter periplasmic adaptor subunit [Teredinibacter turnerae]|uniref:efflux RND transporter periplasmic adaptor subunit n=1 Tax=Teredinibacter turnerae TaxID=2426 RepID=UPI000382DF5E|nr:efflux RND transporter periplasmic adaptor subunit [Teredinibacter turnerae]